MRGAIEAVAREAGAAYDEAVIRAMRETSSVIEMIWRQAVAPP